MTERTAENIITEGAISQAESSNAATQTDVSKAAVQEDSKAVMQEDDSNAAAQEDDSNAAVQEDSKATMQANDSKAACANKKESSAPNLNNGNRFSAKAIAKMGMMAAVACIFGLFRFPILPMVPFLTYDFADIPIIIAAFSFGPVAGILITLVVSFIQAFLLGGDQLYGFIMHVLASGSFVLVSSLIYSRHKTKKMAIVSMLIAIPVMVIIMGAANYFVTPYYYGGAAMKETVVQLMPFILLFNLIKGTANSVITFIVYKRLSPFLHKW